jgi:gamma-glutamylcyclotransferase (GGCT)/AIG2-like uncharacterized protein YtfP
MQEKVQFRGKLGERFGVLFTVVKFDGASFLVTTSCGKVFRAYSWERKIKNYEHWLFEAENLGYQHVAGTVLRIWISTYGRYCAENIGYQHVAGTVLRIWISTYGRYCAENIEYQHVAGTVLRIASSSAHTVYLCVLCESENKQRLFPYTALTDWFL